MQLPFHPESHNHAARAMSARTLNTDYSPEPHAHSV